MTSCSPPPFSFPVVLWLCGCDVVCFFGLWTGGRTRECRPLSFGLCVVVWPYFFVLLLARFSLHQHHRLIFPFPPPGMNGKSILSAMGRHTPEPPGVAAAASSGAAAASPCSSRSSSQRSGTGPRTPGGAQRSPCTQVKTSEGGGNALTPNARPARSPASPKRSPGEIGLRGAAVNDTG